ncbi:YecA family protein [Bacillus weihaiensis]|uniref:YecA family protein n=1 Tax=Bacillus weihaiensis TaxID=1547283 RepID=UPI00235596FA|nr:SEC-C domain-containing protein [Bacillus weihaiensis]
MSVKRNDPCPCGSGKKFKKCCLNKENVIQLHEVKEERFYQQKHSLVLKVNAFIESNVPTSKLYQLHSEFKKRANTSFPNKSIEKGHFDFWLYFFHRFENGLRGIEWYLQENSSKLNESEKEMAHNWENLKPAIVQAVDINADYVLFEDVVTKEQFHVSASKENFPTFAPWIGTIGLLEKYEDLYYFNGVRVFNKPDSVQRAANKVEELVAQHGIGSQDALQQYYPEILHDFLTEPELEKIPTEITQYTLSYKIKNDQAIAEFIQTQKEVIIDSWTPQKKLASWVNNWYQYEDSEIKNPVLVGNVIGSITQDGELLKLNTLEMERVTEFKAMIEEKLSEETITYHNVDTVTQTLPYQVELRNTIASFNEGTAPYFTLYAQNDIRSDLDKKIPILGDHSLLELVQKGDLKTADTYLKNLEYAMYIEIEKEYGTVEVTADFNSVRKELGLPLSPFVTGGDNRVTDYKELESKESDSKTVNQEDIPFFEFLGFTPNTVDNFYSEDIVTFFKEKTEGKADSTVRKYRNCLFDLREILENSTHTQWDSCDEAFWHDVLTIEFPGLYEPLSKTAAKDFMSTLKALSKWLDKQGKAADLGNTVTKAAKNAEEKLLSFV